ncbi:hypothetical protein STEG23_035766 [Scotinomys teguina]
MEAVANQRQREQTVTTVQDKVQDTGNIRDVKLPLDILLCEYESCTTTNVGTVKANLSLSFSCKGAVNPPKTLSVPLMGCQSPEKTGPTPLGVVSGECMMDKSVPRSCPSSALWAGLGVND